MCEERSHYWRAHCARKSFAERGTEQARHRHLVLPPGARPECRLCHAYQCLAAAPCEIDQFTARPGRLAIECRTYSTGPGCSARMLGHVGEQAHGVLIEEPADSL